MRTHLWKAVLAGTLITVSATACDDNLLDEGAGEVGVLQFDRQFASVAPGDTITVSVAPRDQFGNPIATDVDFEACDNKVSLGEVSADSADLFPRTNVEIIGTTDLGNLGYSCVVASADGVEDTIQVLVVPPYLITNVASADAGDTIVFRRSLGQPAFDSDVEITAQSHATPPDDYLHPVFWVRELSTADSLVAVLPVNMTAGDYTFSVDSIGSSQSSIGAEFSITSQPDPATFVDIDNPNGDAVTDTFVVGTIGSEPTQIISELQTGDSNDWYRITVAEDGTLDMFIEWDRSHHGVDFLAYYLYNEPNTVAATNPPRLVLVYASSPDPAELHATVELTAGNYWVRVRNLDAAPEGTSYNILLHMVE